jgi:protein-S-isoprenylcysteine O-methyltransferase Ste14
VALKALVGSGDRIGLFTLPFLVVGLVLNLAPKEEAALAATFGSGWDAYRGSVKIPWL